MAKWTPLLYGKNCKVMLQRAMQMERVENWFHFCNPLQLLCGKRISFFNYKIAYVRDKNSNSIQKGRGRERVTLNIWGRKTHPNIVLLSICKHC
jgi:hypothetical protein